MQQPFLQSMAHTVSGMAQCPSGSINPCLAVAQDRRRPLVDMGHPQLLDHGYAYLSTASPAPSAAFSVAQDEPASRHYQADDLSVQRPRVTSPGAMGYTQVPAAAQQLSSQTPPNEAIPPYCSFVHPVGLESSSLFTRTLQQFDSDEDSDPPASPAPADPIDLIAPILTSNEMQRRLWRLAPRCPWPRDTTPFAELPTQQRRRRLHKCTRKILLKEWQQKLGLSNQAAKSTYKADLVERILEHEVEPNGERSEAKVKERERRLWLHRQTAGQLMRDYGVSHGVRYARGWNLRKAVMVDRILEREAWLATIPPEVLLLRRKHQRAVRKARLAEAAGETPDPAFTMDQVRSWPAQVHSF